MSWAIKSVKIARARKGVFCLIKGMFYEEIHTGGFCFFPPGFCAALSKPVRMIPPTIF